ncbi:hypothetical protein T03_5564 [Trichinella britovi]|uniref:Uncharacterized protein n=1 Tax=Trichinella britovi TaxID=45882 RepID=A0A0V1CB70_TRIBR|nr:hypothetical protein T03_5564 [Trichinella britovi]
MAPTRGPLNACFSTAAALTLDRHRNLVASDASTKTAVAYCASHRMDRPRRHPLAAALNHIWTLCNFEVRPREVRQNSCFQQAQFVTMRSNHLNATWTKLTQTAAYSMKKKESCADLNSLNQKSKTPNRVAHSSRALAHHFCVLIFFLFFIVAYGGAHWLWKLFPVSSNTRINLIFNKTYTLCYGERASGEWIVRIETKRNSSTRPKMMHERLPLKSFLVHKQAFKEGSSSAFRIVYF